VPLTPQNCHQSPEPMEWNACCWLSLLLFGPSLIEAQELQSNANATRGDCLNLRHRFQPLRFFLTLVFALLRVGEPPPRQAVIFSNL